jgi:hypothetical protein
VTPYPSLWIAFCFKFFLLLTVHFYCTWCIQKYIGKIICILYLFILQTVHCISCCLHADKILLKLLKPHKRLNRRALLCVPQLNFWTRWTKSPTNALFINNYYFLTNVSASNVCYIRPSDTQSTEHTLLSATGHHLTFKHTFMDTSLIICNI